MKTIASVVALTVAALGLRVIGLGRLPLWFDEGISLLLVTDRPFSHWLAEVHPPLYYALLLAWTQVSTSDRWLRMLSAVLGALTVPAVYVLGARLLGRASGLWAAAFLTVTWLHVWHSREARMYPVLVLVLLLAVGVRAVPWRRVRRATGILVGGVLVLGTVYGLRHDVGIAEGWREASRYLQAEARTGDALVIQPSHLLAPPRESGRARERAMGEMLLLRYDESGRLRSLPRLSTLMVMHTCQQADVGACMDAALRAAGTSGHVWVVLRDAPLPDPFRRWLDDGLERGPVARFRSIVIERRRLRG